MADFPHMEVTPTCSVAHQCLPSVLVYAPSCLPGDLSAMGHGENNPGAVGIQDRAREEA